MEEKKQVKYRMSSAGIVVLVVLAALADLFSFIPFVGALVGPIFWIIVSIYLWKIKCGLLNAGRLATTLISVVCEIFPVVQELPTIIAGTIAVIVMIRVEDRTGIKVPGLSSGKGAKGLVQGGVTPPRIQPPPLNQGGIRAPSGGLTPQK